MDPSELWIAGGTGGNNDDGIAEQTLQLWDIRTGQRIAPPISHGDSVMSLVISPAGDRIATASRDRYARVFAIPQEDRSWEELSSLVELIAGIQIDSSETPVPVTANAFRQLWDALAERYPEEFETTEAEQMAWLRSRVETSHRSWISRIGKRDPRSPDSTRSPRSVSLSQ